MRLAAWVLVSFAFLASACVTARPTQFSVPPDLGSVCGKHCSALGMRLSAVVIILNSSGCVCEPQDGAVRPAGASAAAGGAAIQVAMEAQRRQQTSTSPSPSHPSPTYRPPSYPPPMGGR